jgi:hypothetical protein
VYASVLSDVVGSRLAVAAHLDVVAGVPVHYLHHSGVMSNNNVAKLFTGLVIFFSHATQIKLLMSSHCERGARISSFNLSVSALHLKYAQAILS